jgi:hypothetical protein
LADNVNLLTPITPLVYIITDLMHHRAHVKWLKSKLRREEGLDDELELIPGLFDF